MSAQNDTQFLIGKLAGPDAERDAIHIAVLPVYCEEDHLFAGTRVKLVPGTTDRVRKAVNPDDPGLGVIDPFLPFEMWPKKGDRVYVFLRPNTIHGLRHHWHLPAVDSPEQLSESEQWLRDFADRWGMDYQAMLEDAQDPEGWVLANGRDLHHASELGDDHDRFWQHLETVTGKRYDATHRRSVTWTCTC